ncbi:MAG: hypothetical protein U1E15_00200 [Hyphomicrobiales bacterium]
MRAAGLGLFLSLSLLGLSAGQAAAACTASATVPWTASGKQGLKLTASAVGASCASPVVVLSVLDAAGKPVWTTARIGENVALFADASARTPKALPGALKEWLTTGLSTSPKSSGDLPPWRAGQENPLQKKGEEFGYFAGSDMSESYYEEQRKAKLPVFCFVQGLESESCIMAGPNASILEFGGRTFPG